jgi:hypothetical protein
VCLLRQVQEVCRPSPHQDLHRQAEQSPPDCLQPVQGPSINDLDAQAHGEETWRQKLEAIRPPGSCF